jgi:hypothetical protein
MASRKRVLFQLQGWVWGRQLLTLKSKLVIECHKGLWTSLDSLDKQLSYGKWHDIWYRECKKSV